MHLYLRQVRQFASRASPFQAYFKRIQPTIQEITTDDLRAMKGGRPLLIDIREPEELKQMGPIPNAVNVPRSHLEMQIERVATDPTQPIVLYCAGGVRSLFSARTLEEMGYQDVKSLAGGVRAYHATKHVQ